MLQVSDVSKSYGGDSLFSQVNFAIAPGEKVGLVGRNGHGKTTLFRLLVGEESPDSGGEIRSPKNYRLGYLRQDISFTASTVLSEAMLALPLEEREMSYKAERILLGLGISKEDWAKAPGELSGGFQVRLNLTKVLLSNAHLLLLDEPTNYLDIVSMRWLAEFLRRWPGEIFLITHDRSFMDSVVNSILGIHRGKIKKISGKTANYFEQIKQEEEIYEKTRLNTEKKVKDIEEFVDKFRAKARQASLAQSRMKTLAKMEVGEKLDAIQELDFRFTYAPMNGKWPLIAKNLSFGYLENKPLFSNISFSLGSNDRLAIIGKNGQGKTTLLNVIAGNLISAPGGELNWHPQVQAAHFAQTNKLNLQEGASIEEEIRSVNLSASYTRVRQICGTMMFEGDKAKKSIKVLSGGEKSRVLLGKILATSANVLLLDEPTHHLDLPSCEALIKSLNEFPGAVILVTHDENFLRAVPNKLIVFQKGGATFFEGGYEDFLRRSGFEEEIQWGDGKDARDSKDGKEIKEDVQKSELSHKELKERRREIIQERAKVLRPLKEEMDKLENKIMNDEELLQEFQLEVLELSQSGPSSQNGKKMGELSQKIAKLTLAIDQNYERLEVVTLQHDEKNYYFEDKIKIY